MTPEELRELNDYLCHEHMNDEVNTHRKRIKELEAINEELNFKMSNDAMMADNRIKELESLLRIERKSHDERWMP